MENDFNLLFVACHNNKSFLTKKKIDEHRISAKNKNNQGKFRCYYIIVKTSMYIASQRLRGNGLLQCKHSLL